MIGVALLGAGYAARIQLACWLAIPGAAVVGVWSRGAERARSLAAEFGVPHFEDCDELVSHQAVDAVDIATSLETHQEFALRAAARGKHVLCQKPLAGSLDDAAAIVRGCEEAGVRLMVNENWRWRPWYREVRAQLDHGVIGRPFALRLASRSSAAVARADRPPESLFARQPFLRRMRPLIGLELGPHHFDIVRFLFGEPADVYARTLKVTPVDHVTGEEVVTALLGYPDRLAQVELSWASIGYPEEVVNPDTLAIEGTDGSLFVQHDGQVRMHFRDGREEMVEVDTTDAYRASWQAALAHFARCLARGEPFETSGTDNLRTLRLVFAAYQSAATWEVQQVREVREVRPVIPGPHTQSPTGSGRE
jgi:predicted dehydrogenase